MKVTAQNGQQNLRSIQYRSSLPQTEAAGDAGNIKETNSDLLAEPDLDTLTTSQQSLSTQGSEQSGSGNFKAKSSTPDDSVGQLASMLARAETRIDVQQVASKAIRALASLKMSAVSSEGKEAKKIAQMIKRMEKLIKRIQKKLQQLGKEEQLEIRQQRAEKQMQEEKAKEIQKELRVRRKKRHKEEQEYANKEVAEDAKNNTSEMFSTMANAISPSSPTASLSPSSPAISAPDLSAVSSEIAVADVASIDVSV